MAKTILSGNYGKITEVNLVTGDVEGGGILVARGCGSWSEGTVPKYYISAQGNGFKNKIKK